MKNLIKSSAFIGSSEIALVLIAIIRSKYIAITIGPSGYGGFGLMNSFFGLIAVLGGGWLGKGVVKYIAEFNKEKDLESVEKIHNLAISLSFFIISILTVAFFIFSQYIRNTFLSPDIIYLHYSLFAASFLGQSLSPVFAFLFGGLILVKKTVYLRIINPIFKLLTMIILVLFFSLTGFYVSIFVSSVFQLFIFWKVSRKYVKTKIKIPNLRDSLIKKVLNFGGVNLFLLFINKLSEFLIRKIILIYSNLSVVGLFQAVYRIIFYLGVMSRGASFYNDPKMSERITNKERNKRLNDFLRFIFLTGIPITVISILFGNILIRILLSESFLPLNKVLYLFIVYAFLSSILSGFHSIIMGQALLKFHTIVTIITHLIWVIIPLLLFKKIGLSSVAYSFIATSVISIISSFIYLNKKYNLFVVKSNINYVFISLILISVSIFIKDTYFVYKLLLIMLSGFILAKTVRKQEWLTLLRVARNKFGKSK